MNRPENETEDVRGSLGHGEDGEEEGTSVNVNAPADVPDSDASTRRFVDSDEPTTSAVDGDGDGDGAGGVGIGNEDDFGGGSTDLGTDVDVLKRVWCNERVAPEILPFEAALVDRLQEQILLMEENIAALSVDIADELMMSLYRMDVNRTLFLLRSYLRTRLSKIEMFVEYIINSKDLSERLSAHELEFAFRPVSFALANVISHHISMRLESVVSISQYHSVVKCTASRDKHYGCTNHTVSRYREVLSKHLKQTVLDSLPENYQSMSRQTSQSVEDDMIPTPQLDTFVVCRTKEAIGSFQLDDRGDETVDLLQDDLHILRYKPVRRLLEANKIELI